MSEVTAARGDLRIQTLTAGLRAVPTAVYLLAILCFSLPFVSVSCGGQRLASLTGAQLVRGTTAGEGSQLAQAGKSRVSPEPLAVAALLGLLGGAALAASDRRGKRLASGALGLAAFLLLLLLKLKLDAEVAREGQGLLHVAYGAGYVGACVFSLLGGGVSTFIGSGSQQGGDSSIDRRSTP